MTGESPFDSRMMVTRAGDHQCYINEHALMIAMRTVAPKKWADLPPERLQEFIHKYLLPSLGPFNSILVAHEAILQLKRALEMFAMLGDN
jgi:hypothetical protein